MPQLVKGGKHTFGWSLVGNTGRIVIPSDALEEYRFKESDKLIMIPGSRTSGGFSLGLKESLLTSPLGAVLNHCPELEHFQTPEGEIIIYNDKPFSWVQLNNGSFYVPLNTLKEYGIKTDDKLLLIRGSGMALGFAVRGPIVEEANMHPELEKFY
jgi:bifunctional DNA-binding transcriptional regulator/antitoxin component of YhaV-PrlF toxin-antitoxin module